MIKNKLIALLVLLLTAFAVPVHAQSFQDFPVVHEGRIKPFGRVAQLTFQKINGEKRNIEQSTNWLASVLFDPIGAESENIFTISEKNLLHVLDLPAQQTPYNFRQLNKAFLSKSDLILSLRQSDPQKLSKDQLALLELYAQVTYFEQLKGSMTVLLPLKTKDNTPQRFIDLEPTIENKKIILPLLNEGKNNQSFRIIPLDKKTWHAPWEIVLNNLSNEQTDTLLDLWSLLAKSYIMQDGAEFQTLSAKLYEATLDQSDDTFLGARLKMELLYNALQPYLFSFGFYIAGLIAAFANKRKMALALIGTGFAFHLFGLVCRMFILQRPPVSDLYESMLFVGAMIIGSSLIYAWRKQETTMLMLGSFLAIILHSIGFALGDSYDTLKVIQAVLDTKFWLATHVTIITTGYAFSLMTSAFAHYCLFCFPPSRKSLSRLYILSLISLVFICIGTLLGGVWADQSWGRFWGWDPKENGALLIALWLVWLLHGKITRHISEFFFVLGLAALSLIVALSWIGVNLLGVGLHSYGFMQGSVTSLVTLYTAELLFFFYCWKQRTPHAL